MAIHPTAVVDPKAELGANVEIGPGAVISAHTKIGDDCTLGPGAVILPYTSIGPRCRIHAHAVLGDLPQDVKFKEGVVTGVEVGADCWIREGVTIHRGTKEGSCTRVGDGCLLMVNSHLGHNVELGRGVILANGALLAGHVTVGDRAFVSGNVVVHQFCRIGRLAMVGGQAAIGRDVLPFCTIRGGSVNQVGGLNVIGLRRAGMAAAERLELKRAFKLVFCAGLNTKQALERMRAEFATGPAAEWIPYLETTRRGICHFDAGTAAVEGDDAE